LGGICLNAFLLLMQEFGCAPYDALLVVILR
jgi:hypothetical protein